ncbi:hypothetical protein ACHAWT_006153 [Skeletonema menzelii]
MGFGGKLSKKKSKRSKDLSKTKSLPSSFDFKDDNVVCRRVSCISIGTGSFTATGVLSVTKSSRNLLGGGDDGTYDESPSSSYEDADGVAAASGQLSPVNEVLVSRTPSIYIRTADLPTMKESANSFMRLSSSDIEENDWVNYIHKPSPTPPLQSMDPDPREGWVALDDGNGNKAPLTEVAMKALISAGLEASLDQNMWAANGPTSKLLKSGDWDETVFVSYDKQQPVPAPHARGTKGEMDVLVWSGTFSHKYYGCDLPAIRCEAIVNMSPKSLAALLVDSNRVKEYNKMSIGRDDILVLQDDEICVTKVVCGRSKPPMLSKILQLKTLLHMEELPGGSQNGYVVASRAVTHAEDAEGAADPKVVHSEMLMGLNIIRAVEGEPDRCVLINVNHLMSPMIPKFMANKLGLSSAVNFINDIRSLC